MIETQAGCSLHARSWGPEPQPRQVPQPEIETATLRFTDWHSVHGATPAKDQPWILKENSGGFA